VSVLAFTMGEVDQSPIGDRLHKAVSEETERNACGADRFAIRHTFLDLRIGKGGTRANGAIVHQSAAGDDLSSMSDGDVGIVKPVIRCQMSHSQFRDLAATTRCRILVTFTAG